MSGRPGGLAMPCATSMRNPSTPRSSQNRSVFSRSSKTSGFVPVQVGLLGVEQVQVPLARDCRPARRPVSRPGRRTPTPSCWVGAGRRAPSRRGRCSAPAARVPGPAASAAWNQGCCELVWLGTRSIVTLMSRACAASIRRSSALEAAEQRVDVARVGDVVAVVGHRRHHDRVQPDRVDAEAAQIVEVGSDAVEVADAVAVAVAERARIDLVEHGVGPPRRAGVGHVHPALPQLRTAS